LADGRDFNTFISVTSHLNKRMEEMAGVGAGGNECLLPRIGMVARLLELGGCMRRGGRRGERRDGVGKVDEKMRRGVKRLDQNCGSVWPGHHTPLLLDSPETSPCSPPISPPASRISQIGNKAAYVPPAWRSPSLGSRLVAEVQASPSRARKAVTSMTSPLVRRSDYKQQEVFCVTLQVLHSSGSIASPWSSTRREAWTSMGEDVGMHTRESGDSEVSSDSEDEWRELHNYSATPYWPDD